MNAYVAAAPPAPLSIFEVVFPDKTNHYETLFGGQVLQMMDKAAFLVASRHARRHVVTVAAQDVRFSAPVRVGTIIEVQGSLTGVGRSSMEIETRLFAEETLTSERTLCAQGRFTLVALDQTGKPVAVPALGGAT